MLKNRLASRALTAEIVAPIASTKAYRLAAILFIIAVVTRDGASLLLSVVCLAVAVAVYLRDEDSTWLGGPEPPPAQGGYQQREPGVWSGVKLGCRMLFVLPILLVLGVIFLIALLSSG